MKLVMLTLAVDDNLQEEGFIVDWVKALAREVEELVVIALKVNPKVTLPTKVKVYEVPVTHKLGKLWFVFRTLNKEYYLGRIDGVFCHILEIWGVIGGLWGRLNGVRSVYWYAGGIPIKLFSFLKVAFLMVEVIATCSEREKRRYRQWWGRQKKVVNLGHAIDIQSFQLIKNRGDEVFTIGYVARATRIKNIDGLIRAFGKLRIPRRLRLHLALARTNENTIYYRKLSELAKSIANERRKIMISTDLTYRQLPDYYRSLDLYVHPSLQTSIDKAALEAVSSGVPVLLSATAYGEVVDTFNQVVVSPFNIRQLARRIESVIQDYSSFVRYQRPLQQLVRNAYSLHTFMPRLVKLFS